MCNTDFATVLNNKTPFYCFMNEKTLFSIENDGTTWGQRFSAKNSIIEMILDVKNKTLSYSVNDEYLGIAFDDINFKDDRVYYMAVLVAPDNKIKLLNFEQNAL